MTNNTDQQSSQSHYYVALILDKAGQDYWSEAIKITGLDTVWPAHVTLFGASKLADDYVMKLERLAKDYKKHALRFEALGHFLSPEDVYYLGVTPTISLLNFHKQAYDLFANCNIFPYWLPDIWIPHCTIALPGDINNIAAWLKKAPQILICHAVELWLCDVTQKTIIHKQPLLS